MRRVVGSSVAIFGCPVAQALDRIGAIEIAEGLPHPGCGGEFPHRVDPRRDGRVPRDPLHRQDVDALGAARRAGELPAGGLDYLSFEVEGALLRHPPLGALRNERGIARRVDRRGTRLHVEDVIGEVLEQRAAGHVAGVSVEIVETPVTGIVAVHDQVVVARQLDQLDLEHQRRIRRNRPAHAPVAFDIVATFPW